MAPRHPNTRGTSGRRRPVCRSAGPVVAVLVGLLSSGCGPEPEAAPVTSVASPSATASSSPTAPTTATAPADVLSSAPVALTTTFDFTAEGGYRASVDVTWHEIQALRFDDLADRFPTCVDLLRQGTDRDASDATVALYGSVVELAASFPAVNGFPWPTTQTLRATADGPDAAYLCGGGPEASYGTFSLSRTMRVGENTASFLFVQMSKKTPENPSGDLADRQIFSKDKVGVDGGGFIETCTATPKPAYVRDGSYGVPSSCGIVESPFLVD